MGLQSMTAIATVTLQANSQEVTFSGISNFYTDLVVTGLARSTRAADAYDVLTFRINSDSANNYAIVSMAAGTTSAGVSESYPTIASGSICRVNTSSSGNTAFNAFTLQILDANKTNKHKVALGRGAATQEAQGVSAYASRWASTVGVSSITLRVAQGDQIAAGTTISLYGRIA